jgi:DNA-binding transcriptional LysR family regulator
LILNIDIFDIDGGIMNNLLRHLRIADLELFITAMHMKSLSKAATIHHLSQSSASAVITRVEAAMGKQLCHHEKRQFRLTHEGNILLPKIEGWLKQFKETILTNAESPLRLVTTNAIARVILPLILPVESIELQLNRPDKAYAAIQNGTADIAIVPDNALWKDLSCTKIGQCYFGLYSSQVDAPLGPILLPEDQIEVLTFMQRWKNMYNEPVAIKARIPSWSLIADLLLASTDVGFLPSFLADNLGLHPVAWQPPVAKFRMLAMHRSASNDFAQRIERLVGLCARAFNQEMRS